VYERRRTYVHEIDIFFQNVMMIREHFRVQAVLFLDTLRLSGDNIHKRNNFAPVRELKICLDMRVGNSAGSDNRDTNHIESYLSVFEDFVEEDPNAV
jgi:hypothetical protein